MTKLNHSDHAKELLRHYFKTSFLAAGLGWDADNDAEVDEIIDEIENSAYDTAARIADKISAADRAEHYSNCHYND